MASRSNNISSLRCAGVLIVGCFSTLVAAISTIRGDERDREPLLANEVSNSS
ncbi:Chloride channel protein CLC-e [Corchorus olitorius]|uniref:Chloride channel protein CLC-e n=1 Tax=Corchorus olitorius TaxID=93759 RepID=A0A1R3HGV0_9ROSI|nr:Chloride channel protein CLC-e [Corchorus olitorius]